MRDEETAVVMTAAEDMVPRVLLQSVHRMHVMPGRLVLYRCSAAADAHVKDDEAVTIRKYGRAATA